MPCVERPPVTPSIIRHGQIASQLQLSKYDPPTEYVTAPALTLSAPAQVPWTSGPARRFQPENPRLVRGSVRCADPCPDPRLAGDRERKRHADPGPDGLRQDARGLPLRDRQAQLRARRGPAPDLRLAPQGPELRHRAQPAWAARRPAVRAQDRRAHRRHAAERARSDAAEPARHPDHDSRVAVSHAHLSRAREPEGCPDTDPR